MKKEEAVIISWKIATLSNPTNEIMKLLMGLEYKLVLELLLILRKNPAELKDPLAFIKALIANPQEFQCQLTNTSKKNVDKSIDLSELSPIELGNTRKKESIKYIIPFLESDNLQEKTQATTAIKKLARAFPSDSEKALDILAKNLNDAHPRVRHYTLSTLERFTLRSEILTKILWMSDNDEKEYIRKAAQRIVKKEHIGCKKRYIGNRGIVYFLREKLSGSIKIGRTQNFDRRLENFGVKLPFEVELIYKFECGDCNQVEKMLHDYFDKKRIDGEWFDIRIDDLAWIINGDYPEGIKKFI
ncbi:GIY-YIG nuclease family protein [Anaerobacillus sp. 1_MG-2023]|uniref:GIY-YIG nuclease family protein n=1 Tax=Anaerobacillus sp. 1_MG-2023 TaxID=3062655 RepID=UPI0026E3CC07|nr:GIY-YIG nuclease family protein [Anaerobacillus sp. 1_MG-2023]MDO6658004.1 GIY-YIG nuclease family protein [Anaerobacillus sp. 1_MG-2023]